MKTAALVFASLLSTAAIAAPACNLSGLPAIAGKSYHVARGLMIDSGARPVMQTTPDDITTREPVSLGYAEVEGCTGSGSSLCRFSWSDKNGKPFAVITDSNRVRRLVCD